MPVCLMVKDRLKSRHRLFNDFPRVKSLFGHLRVRVRWSSLRARAVCCWHWRGPVASEPCRWRAWDLGRWEPGGDHGPRLCRAKRLEDGWSWRICEESWKIRLLDVALLAWANFVICPVATDFCRCFSCETLNLQEFGLAFGAGNLAAQWHSTAVSSEAFSWPSWTPEQVMSQWDKAPN